MRQWVLRGLVAILALWIGGQGVAERSPLFFGPEKAVPFQKVPEGLTSLTAESCGTCHEEIYKQWKTSLHSQATVDPIFQTCWTARNKPPFCTNCHFPLANQKPKVLRGFKASGPLPFVMLDNPRFDPVLLKEGVTCAACHVRGGTVLGPRRPEEMDAPHPVAYDERFITSQFCYSCHGWTFPRTRLDATCDTIVEYERIALEERATCQACHMPEVEGSTTTGGPVRRYRAHSENVSHRAEEIAKALTFEVALDKPGYSPGDRVRAEIRLANSGAAHRVPTACGVRPIHLGIQVVDEQGNVRSATDYRISRYFEFPAYPSETQDTRLEPGESRTYTFDWAIPSGDSGRGLSLQVDLIYYLVHPKKAEEAPLALDRVTVPLRSVTVPLT